MCSIIESKYARLADYHWDEKLESPDTCELINRCLEYRKLYYLRYNRCAIKLRTIKRFSFLSDILSAPGFSFKSVKSFVPSSYCNLFRFLQEVSKIEEDLGYFLWSTYFITSDDLYGNDFECRSMFNIIVSSILENLFKAVMNRDWFTSGLIIAQAPIYPSKLYHEVLYQRLAIKAFSLYLPRFYLTSLQIFLESGKSINAISQRYFYALDQFMRTHLFSRRTIYDNSEFYAAHFLIFHLANLLFDMADSVVEFNLIKRNSEWTRCLLIYKYHVDYEKFVNKQLELRNKREPLVNSLDESALYASFLAPPKNSFISNFDEVVPSQQLFSFFSTAFCSLLHNPLALNGHADDSTGLLPIFVHLAKLLGKLDELEQGLTEICLINSVSLERVHRILLKFQLDHIAGRLFSKAIALLPPEILACHDFIIEIVEQRSLEPSNFGPLEEVVLLNLKYLFNFFDFGRNRCNERAWPLLYSNMRYIESEFTKFVEPFWSFRRSWWPHFHLSQQLNGVARKTRKSVFKMLEEKLVNF